MKNKYSKYKSSGVNWIGEIPKHWRIGKLYQYGKLYSGSTPLSSEDKYWENGDIPWMSSGEINKKIIRNIDGRITQLGREKCNSPMLPINTVMMGLNGQGKTKGTVGILEIETTCNQSLCGIVFNESVIPYYQYYYLETQYYNLRGLVGEGQREGISVSFLKLYPTIIPPIQEQEQIVKYLDEKTLQIDTLISLTKNKIEQLKEERTSLINTVVTKGIDPNIEMKDSGVEWIGKIPNHWEVKKMKYCLRMISEKMETSKDDIKISPENVENNTGKCFNLYSEYTGEGMKFIKGDILLNKLRIYLKKIILTDYDGFSMGEMIVLRTTNGNKKYFYYTIYNQGLIDLLSKQSTGVKLPRVSPDIILNSQIVFPPISEQENIVSYLDVKTQEIDQLISIENRRIETLKEYKQSLISEIVTGKIRICEEDFSLDNSIYDFNLN